MTPEQESKLEALYATLPKINCKGKCGESCGPLLIPRIEFERIEKKVGFVQIQPEAEWYITPRQWFNANKADLVGLQAFGNLDCRMLSSFGRCQVYAVRPLVCRLWGTMQAQYPYMHCRFGCEPERWLSAEEVSNLFKQVIEIQNNP
jgi:Fe-S-cluster containining protein